MSRTALLTLTALALSLSSSATALADAVAWDLSATGACTRAITIAVDGAVTRADVGTIPFEDVWLFSVPPTAMSLGDGCLPELHLEGVELVGVDPASVVLDTPIPLSAEETFVIADMVVSGRAMDPTGQVVETTAFGDLGFSDGYMVLRREIVSLEPYAEAVVLDATLLPATLWIEDPGPFEPGSVLFDAHPPVVEVPGDKAPPKRHLTPRPEHPSCQHCMLDVPDDELETPPAPTPDPTEDPTVPPPV